MPMSSLLNRRGTREVGEETSRSSFEVALSWPSRSPNSRSLYIVLGATNEGEVIMGATFGIVGGV